MTTDCVLSVIPLSTSLIRTLNVWYAMVPDWHKNPSGYGPKVIPIRLQPRSTKIMERILAGKPISDRKLRQIARKHPDIRESEGIDKGGVEISTHWPSYCRLLALSSAKEFDGDERGDTMMLPLPSLTIASKTAGTGSNHRCKSSIFAMTSMTSLTSNLAWIPFDGTMSISTTNLSWHIRVARTGVHDERGATEGRDRVVDLALLLRNEK
mmetsp:Transcript_38358/g.92506  ORF Transcript_38358/g.92506 Transcript_38358/m.92506 type:complete len:210 (+) Transcript_38358:470-1099(+)